MAAYTGAGLDRTVSLRGVQVVLGLAYLIVDVLALARLPDPVSLAACVAAGAIAYLSARALPPLQIPLQELWRAVGVGALVLAVAAALLVLAPASQLIWVQIVSSYACANRLRAGALFRPAEA